VTTVDGYKLTLYRIPGPKGEKTIQAMRNAKNRQPVLMLHGVVGSSQDFTFTGPGFNNQSDGNVTGKGIPF